MTCNMPLMPNPGGEPSGRRFLKMHGLRNHFVIVDARDEPFRPTVEEIVRICDAQTGIGGDQLIVIEPATGEGADECRWPRG